MLRRLPWDHGRQPDRCGQSQGITDDKGNKQPRQKGEGKDTAGKKPWTVPPELSVELLDFNNI